jgi:uncharacterized metal-binding protein YceD (DUF177 family)
MTIEPKPEFSRPFPSEKLRDRPMSEHIEANEAECEALAKRLDLVAVKSLVADMNLSRVHGGATVEVKGSFTADIVQTCVVTLEPFESRISEPFDAYFVRAETIPNVEEVEIEQDRSPEAIGPDGEIDLGELTAQHLSLALDPYPRKPGVVFQQPANDGDGPKPKNPFAVLAGLKPEKDTKNK